MLPESWISDCAMERVICHWSAGGHEASWLDREHYHLIIEADGNLVRGKRAIADNARPIRGNYAAHTWHSNTGSIGVSLACMAGAQERPFDAGSAPMTLEQWQAMVTAVAELCRRYRLDVTPETVLSHAEVAANLGIRQRGKWDYTRAAVDWSLEGARAIGDRLRAAVQAELNDAESDPAVSEPAGDDAEADKGPQPMELVGTVTASWLNFRASAWGTVIGGLPRGIQVAVLDREGGWYRVRSPAGYLGWVSGRYVALD